MLRFLILGKRGISFFYTPQNLDNSKGSNKSESL